MVDVAKIGTRRRSRSSWRRRRAAATSARRTREIYFTPAGGRGGTGVRRSTSTRRQTRARAARARTLINADETLTVVKNANAADPDGKYPRPPARAPRAAARSGCFPGKKMEELTPDQQYAVTKEDGLAPRALNPGAAVVRVHRT